MLKKAFLYAKEGIGIDALKAEMVKAVVGEMDLENDTIIATRGITKL